MKEALWFGAALALAAFGLVLTTNMVTIAWSFAALAVAGVLQGGAWVLPPSGPLAIGQDASFKR